MHVSFAPRALLSLVHPIRKPLFRAANLRILVTIPRRLSVKAQHRLNHQLRRRAATSKTGARFPRIYPQSPLPAAASRSLHRCIHLPIHCAQHRQRHHRRPMHPRRAMYIQSRIRILQCRQREVSPRFSSSGGLGRKSSSVGFHNTATPYGSASGRSSNSTCMFSTWLTPDCATSSMFRAFQIPPPECDPLRDPRHIHAGMRCPHPGSALFLPLILRHSRRSPCWAG